MNRHIPPKYHKQFDAEWMRQTREGERKAAIAYNTALIKACPMRKLGMLPYLLKPVTKVCQYS